MIQEWPGVCRDGWRMKHQFKIGLLFAVLFGALFSSACHTMQGAGQDIQKGGEKLEDAAQKANH